jgi:plasmid stability protein
MTDLLIRDVPDDVLAAIDARAKRLGVSRTEYVRRQLAQSATGSDEPVEVDHLRRFAGTFADLGDPVVMARAWRQAAG